MKKIECVVMAGLFGTLALASFQAGADEFAPKRNEVSFFGSIDNQSTNNGGGSSTAESVYASYGRYFTPQIVGTVNGFIMQSGSGSTKMTLTNVGVGAKYYFKVGKAGDWTPFVEGGVEASSVDSGGTSYSGAGVTVAGGVTYWLTEAAGLNIDGRYKTDSYTVSGVSITTTHTMAEFGLTVKF